MPGVIGLARFRRSRRIITAVTPGWPMFLDAHAKRMPTFARRHAMGLLVKSELASTTRGTREARRGRSCSSRPLTVSLEQTYRNLERGLISALILSTDGRVVHDPSSLSAEMTVGVQYLDASSTARLDHVPLTTYVASSPGCEHRFMGTAANWPCPPPCAKSISYSGGTRITSRVTLSAFSSTAPNSGLRWLCAMDPRRSSCGCGKARRCTSASTAGGRLVGSGLKLRTLPVTLAGGVRLPCRAGWDGST
mmetsp:Transcript_18047/g.41471  ORF Transcript_18047/g.41471 Transcript_18047/m.41471 type:complete len:250 (-) Transcript_18047:391-1140(-)